MRIDEQVRFFAPLAHGKLERDIGIGNPVFLCKRHEQRRHDLLDNEIACKGNMAPEKLTRAERVERGRHGRVVVVDAVDLPIPAAHAEDEIARLRTLGVLEDLLRRARLPQLAAIHIEHARARVTGEAHLVCDHEHRVAPFGEALDNRKYLRYHLRI